MLICLLLIFTFFNSVNLLTHTMTASSSRQYANSYYPRRPYPLRNDAISFGSCRVVINRHCPDPEINFYLYSEMYPKIPEPIRIGADHGVSNLSSSQFDPNLPTKIIIHGYNSDMFLSALVEVKEEYIKHKNFNVFAVDWGTLAQGPCYPAAIWNARLAGRCTAQLVDRIRETGASDIHLIGFSLGAHVTNFVANNLHPYKVSRITGLDPAMPGFITVGLNGKLDPSDAEFVDVIHTNAFMQGKVEQSGHVDFYMNGGIVQPGCWVENRFFACNHHRAPIYFAESINSQLGFWGWPCSTYLDYLLGRCPPKDPQILMGENIAKTSRGLHLVITESIAPYAVGKYTGPTIEILVKNAERYRIEDFTYFKDKIMRTPDLDDVIDVLQQEASNNHYVTNAYHFVDFNFNYTDDANVIMV